MNPIQLENVGPYFEYKYIIPLRRLPEVSVALNQYLHKPERFAVGKTTSYYFDTEDLDEYQLGLSGYTQRQKLRYRILEAPDLTHSYFIEFKEKLNDSVYKLRGRLHRDISQELDHLDQVLLNEDQTFAAQFLGASRNFILRLESKLKIVYTRHRYICPISNGRVNLDVNLSSTNHLQSPVQMGVSFHLAPYAVLEMKSPVDGNLPPFLQFLGLHRTAFSKYCYFMSKHLGDKAYSYA